MTHDDIVPILTPIFPFLSLLLGFALTRSSYTLQTNTSSICQRRIRVIGFLSSGVPCLTTRLPVPRPIDSPPFHRLLPRLQPLRHQQHLPPHPTYPQHQLHPQLRSQHPYPLPSTPPPQAFPPFDPLSTPIRLLPTAPTHVTPSIVLLRHSLEWTLLPFSTSPKHTLGLHLHTLPLRTPILQPRPRQPPKANYPPRLLQRHRRATRKPPLPTQPLSHTKRSWTSSNASSPIKSPNRSWLNSWAARRPGQQQLRLKEQQLHQQLRRQQPTLARMNQIRIRPSMRRPLPWQTLEEDRRARASHCLFLLVEAGLASRVEGSRSDSGSL